MILPITPLFNRSGLPGGGVPAFTIDPESGDIVGEVGHLLNWEDPNTGLDPESGGNSDYVALDENGQLVSVPILNTGSLLQKHGARVWNRPGSYRDESDFALWRRAGKPPLCRAGMGDTTAEVLAAFAAGSNAAAAGYAGYPYPGYQQPRAQVAVAGSASPAAWILGGIAVAVVLYGISKR